MAEVISIAPSKKQLSKRLKTAHSIAIPWNQMRIIVQAAFLTVFPVSLLYLSFINNLLFITEILTGVFIVLLLLLFRLIDNKK